MYSTMVVSLFDVLPLLQWSWLYLPSYMRVKSSAMALDLIHVYTHVTDSHVCLSYIYLYAWKFTASPFWSYVFCLYAPMNTYFHLFQACMLLWDVQGGHHPGYVYCATMFWCTHSCLVIFTAFVLYIWVSCLLLHYFWSWISIDILRNCHDFDPMHILYLYHIF